MVTRSRIVLAAVSWAVGLLAYLLVLRVAWDQSISFGDLLGVVQLSGVAWALTYAFLYIPVLSRFRRRVPSTLRFCVLPIVALPLGLVSVVLVWLCFGIPLALFGYGWSSLSTSFFTSPEASLFYWFFGAASVVVGIGLACIRSPSTI